ncbi:MAG: hypothetical protein VX951_12605 [Planctomycetota bacterium]|nr:hypothetical protein [Planctomycetota bacterium]
MRIFPTAAVATILLATLVPAQLQAKLESLSSTGALVQVAANSAVVTSRPPGTVVTVLDPISVVADTASGGVAHARTKASLRLLPHFAGALPAVRIYEAGSIMSVATPTRRQAGTTSNLSTPSGHSWLLELKDLAERRLRLQVRLRSTIAGTGVSGTVEIDVGNDSTPEFQGLLDGSSLVVNLPVTLDANGEVDIKIKTEALIDSSSLAASSYSATLDAVLEPFGPALTTLERYGTSCGPRMELGTWTQGLQRFTMTGISNAAPNAPAMLLVGIGEIDIALGGGCSLRVHNILVSALVVTDSSGKLTHNYPPFLEQLSLDVTLQYLVLESGQIKSTEGARCVSRVSSGNAFDYVNLNQVLSTGQSLSVGSRGGPVLSSTQPFRNKMFSSGVCGAATNRFVPLIETTVETHHSSMANLVTEMAENEVFKNLSPPQDTHALVVSCHGKGGAPYGSLKKGSLHYAKGLEQGRRAKIIADASAQSYVVRAVTNVHGESDHNLQNSTYDLSLADWQADYENDVRALTGQLQPVPMLHTQMSSWTRLSGNGMTSQIPLLQLKASTNNPRKIVLVGPKYHLDYWTDGLHLFNDSYRHMGEYYGRVYRHVILEGGTWEPLRPIVAKRNNATLLVRFHVPVPPLVLDTTLVTDPGNYGFEFWDNSANPRRIVSVELVDEDTVKITLSAIPAGTEQFVRYAYTGVPAANAGPTTGPRGNLRDSDPSLSRFGSPLFNWAVHFDLRVQ